MRVAIYARSASRTQTHSVVEQQVRFCQLEAVSNGWDVSDIYVDDGMSGMRSDRPELQRLRLDASNGRFDRILTMSIDRLHRDQAQLAHLLKEFAFRNISIASLELNRDNAAIAPNFVRGLSVKVVPLSRSGS